MANNRESIFIIIQSPRRERRIFATQISGPSEREKLYTSPVEEILWLGSRPGRPALPGRTAEGGCPTQASALHCVSRAILPRMRLRVGVPSLVLILSLTVLPLSLPLNARVVRVAIASRTDVLNRKQFGDAGAYERITGRVYFSLPVANTHNLR